MGKLRATAKPTGAPSVKMTSGLVGQIRKSATGQIPGALKKFDTMRRPAKGATKSVTGGRTFSKPAVGAKSFGNFKRGII